MHPRHFLYFLMTTLSLSSCRTQSGGSDIKDLLVEQTDGKRRIYFMDGVLIKTGVCKDDLPEVSAESKPEDVRKLCQNQLSAGVTPQKFKESMLAMFKQTYRASELSAYEHFSLNQLMQQIQEKSAVSLGWEAQQTNVNPFEIDSIWLQFMPFAAGASQAELPPQRAPVDGTQWKTMTVTLGQSQAEYEIAGANWKGGVNLFTVMASTEDKKGICPAYVDILSVSRIENKVAIPVFGGIVVGGSRFLLNKPEDSIANMRITVNPDFENDRYREGVKCVLGFMATNIKPLELNYKITIPDPMKMDARDLKMAELMALPDARMWHFLWHGIRNSWVELSPAERSEIVKKLGPEWSIAEGGTGDRKQRGEEFLHMHHQMLNALKQYLGDQMYDAWPQPPAPNDPKYPVPSYVDPAMKEFLDARYQTLMDLHRQAIDPAFVKSRTLSDYGLWLEENLHDLMHSTWAHPTQWYSAYAPTMQEIMSNPDKYPLYNHYTNNSLSGTYSSHVNPFFYRLHGYIEARIQTWLDVHGFKTVAEKCAKGDSKCYQWQRTWEGKFPSKVAAAIQAHEHGIDPKKVQSLSEPLFREIAKNSQMIPGDTPKN